MFSLSARNLAWAGLVLCFVGVMLLAIGAKVPGVKLEVLLGGFVLLLSAVVTGMVALILALVGKEFSVSLPLAVVAFLLPLVVTIAILFPVFRSARTKARAVICLQHLKKLSTATLMYLEDYDGYFPPAKRWCDCIRPYTASAEDYRCPEAQQFNSGYAMNALLSGQRQGEFDFAPDEVVLFFDAKGGWNLAGGRDLVAPRHTSGANYSFADGHAKWWREPGMVRWDIKRSDNTTNR